MLTIQEIRALSDKELTTELAKARRELVRLKLAVRSGQEKATHKVRSYKNYVARLSTVVKTFELEASHKSAVTN